MSAALSRDDAERALRALGLTRFACVMGAQFCTAGAAAEGTRGMPAGDARHEPHVHAPVPNGDGGEAAAPPPEDALGCTALPHACAWLRQLLLAADAGARYTPSVLRPPTPWQRGCPEIIPGLTAQPLWAAHAHPFIADTLDRLRSACAHIKRELLELRGVRAFQPYRAPRWSRGSDDTRPVDAPPEARAALLGDPGADRGDWNVMYLQLHNQDCAAAAARCPITMATIAMCGHRAYGHALFSATAPGTHIPMHTGPTNKKLRFQLPLIVPPGEHSRLRVGPSVHVLCEGEPFVFDDSFQHEAWHEHPSEPRLVLIFDVWHPDLTPQDIKLLSFVRAAQMRAAKALSDGRKQAHADGVSIPGADGVSTSSADGDDFYAVLAAARAHGVDDDAVFGPTLTHSGVDVACAWSDGAAVASIPVRDD